MRKNFKRVMSCVMSLVMVITSVTVTSQMTKADVTIEQMVANPTYNLALGKTITANPSRQEGSEEALTDGNLSSNHAATTFGTAGTYYELDLVNTYDASTLDQLVVQYKEYNTGDIPVKGYKIQYSTDGINFNDVKTVSASDFTSQVTKENLLEVQDLSTITGGVRYIRLYYPDSYGYGIQAREIAVLDTNQDQKTIQVEKCAEAAGVTVESTDYNTIKYNITAGENQDGFVYMVYLNGTTKIGHGVSAGTDYTVSGIEAGLHTVKVVAIDNGKISNGITSEPVIVNDISALISNKKNLTNKNYNSKAAVVGMSSVYDGHTLTTAQVALDGNTKTGEGTDTALRTGSGSPQSVVIDLGDYYVASEMDRVLLAHTNANTYPANVSVEFSLDNEDYEKVGEKTGYKYSNTETINTVILDDVDSYTQAAVRYVKLSLSAGGSNWGYVVNEISVIANTDEPTIKGSDIPEAAEIITDTSSLETIKYTVVAGENQEGATYVIKLGQEIVGTNVEPGIEYSISGLEAGDYVLTVCTLLDGWQSKGISKNVVVDGYINYVNKPLNLAHHSSHPNVIATCDNDNLPPNYLQGSQDISAGTYALNDGNYTNYAHHSGYLQTRPDNDEANIIYDLAHDYLPTDITSVMSMYESNGNFATEYEILFSADGENYEQVYYVKGAKFKKVLNDYVDISKYTQDTVRFVKYHIINGNYGRHYKDDGTINWGSSGYHLCELAVMGKETLLPEKVSGFTATSPAYNKILVNWIDLEDPDATYRVYLNGSPVGSDIAPGVQTMEFTISAGTYEIAVASVKGEFASTCQSVTVVVEQETTTPPPTTTPKPTTVAPTTQAPVQTTTKAPQVTVKPTTAAPTTQAPTQVTKPGKANIKKAKAGKKKVSLKLKKVAGAKGYQIKYSTNKKVKKAKTKNTTKLNVVIKKLKSGKKYYFKARAYKVVNGKKLYGSWSKIKASKKVK